MKSFEDQAQLELHKGDWIDGIEFFLNEAGDKYIGSDGNGNTFELSNPSKDDARMLHLAVQVVSKVESTDGENHYSVEPAKIMKI